MSNIFKIDRIDQNQIHFTITKEGSNKCNVYLYDTNSKLPIHSSYDWELNHNCTYFICSSDGGMYTDRWTLKIETGEESQSIELEMMFGENRTPVMFGKPVVFAHDDMPAYYTLLEVFYHKVYDRDFVKVEKGDVVVDIGANIGMFSVYSQNFYPSRVIAIEPGPKQYECLVKNTSIYPNVETYEFAAAEETGKASFILSEMGVTNRLDNHFDYENRIDDYVIEKIEVDTVNINEIISDLKLEKIDFLKVDCEGAELAIFRALDKDYLKNKVKKIALEYHSKFIRNEILKIANEAGLFIENSSFWKEDREIGILYLYNQKLFNL
jgi:FkbM family methyltransferase